MSVDELRSRIAHLYRRAGFGARPEEIDTAVAAGYEATVEKLVALDGPDTGAAALTPPALAAPAAAAGVPATPEARRQAQKARQDIQDDEVQRLTAWWIDRMVLSSTPLRERLTLFWHGHFATSLPKVKPNLLYRQNEIFRRLGTGNFEALVQEVAKDPAMLVWLDASQNRKGRPNENFARELFELFLLGIGNYNENDIEEAARAFTGWRYLPPSEVFTVATALHDAGTKTVFGQSGSFGGEDVIHIAIDHPASAAFVTAKVWSGFARPIRPDDPIVLQLAPAFARDLDIAKLLKAIFLHPDFTSPATRTGLVKQPIEYAVGALRALGLLTASIGPRLPQVLESLGQQPFFPPNVGGWPPNDYWLTTSFALARLRFASTIANQANLDSLTSMPPPARPSAVARLLTLEGWTRTTKVALDNVASDPRTLLTLALVSPEYVLA